MKSLKLKYYLFTLIVLGLVIPACKKSDWFDIKSDKNLAVPATLKDMQALLDNSNSMNSSTPELGEIASDNYYLGEQFVFNDNALNAYTWSNEQRYEAVPDWSRGSINVGNRGGYVRVFYANLVLDGLKKISSSTQNKAELENIKGQALFHRAHAFFELAQVFAPSFETATAGDKLGIPIRLEADINIPSTRSTLKLTYDQIINDLLYAKDLLPESPLFKTRPSKQAVDALLARVFLSMENYEQAKIFANQCLNRFSTLIDYSTLNLNNSTNPFVGYNSETIFYCTNVSTSLFGAVDWSQIFISNSFYNLYDDHDERKKAFFNFDVVKGIATYKGSYSGFGFDRLFSGLATDELFLIRAECNAREGKIAASMDDLNTLMEKRWSANYVEMVATSADDALRIILLEREKELIFRGVRWSDLRRLNKDPRFAKTFTRTVNGKTYTLSPNSFKYTFPIPEDIIEKTGMKQNEGW